MDAFVQAYGYAVRAVRCTFEEGLNLLSSLGHRVHLMSGFSIYIMGQNCVYPLSRNIGPIIFSLNL